MTTFKYLLAACFFSAIMWFVSFQYSPYNFCKDHPDPKLSKHFYLCKPFGFKLEKGTLLERKRPFVWEKQGQYFLRSKVKEEKPVKKKKNECDKYHSLLDREDWEKYIDSVPSHCLDSLEGFSL